MSHKNTTTHLAECWISARLMNEFTPVVPVGPVGMVVSSSCMGAEEEKEEKESETERLGTQGVLFVVDRRRVDSRLGKIKVWCCYTGGKEKQTLLWQMNEWINNNLTFFFIVSPIVSIDIFFFLSVWGWRNRERKRNNNQRFLLSRII